MRMLNILSVFALGLASCSAGADIDPNGPMVEIADFNVIEGTDWSGNLTYLDYGSEKTVTIPTTATVEIASANTIKYTVSYPKEPWEDTKAKLKITKLGRLLDGHVVTSRETIAADTLEIQTLHRGDDDGRDADIRLTYNITAKAFSISKDVRFSKEKDYLNRNSYSFTR